MNLLHALLKLIAKVGLLLLVSGFAQAASFDCAKAQSKVEHIICDNPEISKLDEELSANYKAALEDRIKTNAIKQEQKQWLKERNGCSDAGCIQGTYQKRLDQLLSSQSTPAQHIELKPVLVVGTTETDCPAPKVDWRNYEWTLITGKDEVICVEMLTYLKSRPQDAPPPVCPAERLPPNKDWTRPEARILSDEERQALIQDIPQKWRQIPGGPVSYERKFREAKLMRVIRADITRDGIPETFLAYSSHDYRQTCARATRCARDDDTFHHEIVIGWGGSDFYDLLPMNEKGTQVNWDHPLVREAVGVKPVLMNGELIYYKKLPYWMTFVSWYQGQHDNFSQSRMRADDPYSAMFSLDMVSYSSKNKSPNFGDVTMVSPQISDPENDRICRFGYFHRDNLKFNPPKGRK